MTYWLCSFESAATTDDNDYWSEDNGNFFDYASSSAWVPPTEMDTTGMNSLGNIGSAGWREASMQASALASYNSSTQILFTHSQYNSLSNGAEGTASETVAVDSFKSAQVDSKGVSSSAPIDDALGRCHSGSSSGSCYSDIDVPAGQRAVVAVTLPGEDHTTLLEVKPRPRRRKFGKGGKHSLGGRPNRVDEGQAVPIQLTAALLRQHFAMPLHDAARALGICATAVKKVCRKMGIKQWPFQRLKPIQSRLAKLRLLHRNRTRTVGAQGAAEMALEIKQLEAQESILLQGFDDSAL